MLYRLYPYFDIRICIHISNVGNFMSHDSCKLNIWTLTRDRFRKITISMLYSSCHALPSNWQKSKKNILRHEAKEEESWRSTIIAFNGWCESVGGEKRGWSQFAPLNNNNNGAGRRAVGACSRELGSEERATPSCTQTRGWNAIYAIMHRRP